MTKTFEKLPYERRQAILDAAAAVFAQKGYFQAGIAEICQAAGISNGALYKYFGSKSGLFSTLLGQTLELLRQRSQEMSQGQIPFWQRMERIMAQVEPFIAEYRDYFMIYMDLGSPHMAEFAAEISDRFEGQSVQFFRDLVEQAKSEGQLRPGLQTGPAVYTLDNHLMFLAYSAVSEHYDRRFSQYLAGGRQGLSMAEKAGLVVESLKKLLGPEPGQA